MDSDVVSPSDDCEVVPVQRVIENEPILFDYTESFTTNQVFDSRELLFNWVQKVGKQLGLVIVVKRSEQGGCGRRPRVRFGCERSGKYRKYNNYSDCEPKRKRLVGTHKCECPFDPKGIKLPNEDEWMVKVLCGLHNHRPAQHLEGHPYVARLTSQEENILTEMSKNLVKPRNILTTLKERNPENVSTMRTIYNARARHRLVEKAGRTQTQQLMKKLKEHNYIEWHRYNENTDEVRDIFFAHPRSVDLLKAFPHVLIVDCTYKTNRYKCPLFEIVGVTSTQMTFSVAFVFMESEREANYTWAMEKLKTLMNKDVLPQVIVTDRDLALIQSIANVFPTAKNLLCRWHISKNVSANTKKCFGSKDVWENFCKSWSVLVASTTIDIYEQSIKTLFLQFERFPQALDYIQGSRLSKYKEKFIAAWTNKIMHFGNVTTNRAESAHSKLKKHLGSSQSDFETSWKVMHYLVELQFTEIKASFEQSMNMVQHGFKRNLFRELRGFVSRNAMDRIFKESRLAENVGFDKSTCNCTLRSTHGLPCACELSDYILTSRPIPLSAIHSHWRKLDILAPSNEASCQLNILIELENIQKRFNESDDTGKLILKMKLRELYEPSTTSLVPPIEKFQTKGRPSARADTSTKRDPSYFEIVESGNNHRSPSTASSIKIPRKRKLKIQRPCKYGLDQYSTSFHDNVKECIFNIVNVKSDGNCGFREVASSLGMGEDAWCQIRHDLIQEINSNCDTYRKLYGSNERVEELLYILNYFSTGTPLDRWMTMPDMGHLIASRYNVVVVFLSYMQCLTFLPLRSLPPPLISHKIISLGFVNGNHFVQVNLKPNSPIPPVELYWHKYRDEIASKWESPYTERILSFKQMIGIEVATQETIDLRSE